MLVNGPIKMTSRHGYNFSRNVLIVLKMIIEVYFTQLPSSYFFYLQTFFFLFFFFLLNKINLFKRFIRENKRLYLFQIILNKRLFYSKSLIIYCILYSNKKINIINNFLTVTYRWFTINVVYPFFVVFFICTRIIFYCSFTIAHTYHPYLPCNR